MTTLTIPDMHCGKCRASVEAALRGLEQVRDVCFDAEARLAHVIGDASDPTLIAVLNNIGFDAQIRP